MLLVSYEQHWLKVHEDRLIRLKVEQATLHYDAQELKDELPASLVWTYTLQLQLNRGDKLG